MKQNTLGTHWGGGDEPLNKYSSLAAKRQFTASEGELLWNSQNREHQKYLWNVIMLREISQ